MGQIADGTAQDRSKSPQNRRYHHNNSDVRVMEEGARMAALVRLKHMQA